MLVHPRSDRVLDLGSGGKRAPDAITTVGRKREERGRERKRGGKGGGKKGKRAPRGAAHCAPILSLQKRRERQRFTGDPVEIPR